MRRVCAVSTLAVLLAVAVPATASAFKLPTVTQSVYNVYARASLSVDWSKSTGPIGTKCENWVQDEGSDTLSFRTGLRGTTVTIVKLSGQPLRFSGGLRVSANERRSWRKRTGNAFAAGCPNVCPSGSAARVADFTCFPAVADTPPPTTDCGARKTSRASSVFAYQEAGSQIAVGLPLWNPFKRCSVASSGVNELTIPVPLSTLTRLRVGAKRSLTNTQAGRPCEGQGNTTGSCTYDFTVKLVFKRVR